MLSLSCASLLVLLSLSCTSLSCCFLRALACRLRPRNSASKATCAGSGGFAVDRVPLWKCSACALLYLPYRLCCLQAAVLAGLSNLCCPSLKLQTLLGFADTSICSHLQQAFLDCACELLLSRSCATFMRMAPSSSAFSVRKESAAWEVSGRVSAGSLVILQTSSLPCSWLKQQPK